MAHRDNYENPLGLSATPKEVFFNRREFAKAAAASLAALTTSCAVDATAQEANEKQILTPPLQRPGVFPASRNSKFAIPEALPRRELTERRVAATHNNFYEFLPGRGGPVWRYAQDFKVDPWKVEIGGECLKPMTLDLDDLFEFPHEERLYHFRCVERWAMNVPWSGFPLSALLKKVEPKSTANFVRFVSAERPKEMPGLKEDYYPWPYQEALRFDEAMHDLTLVATGVYGEPLLRQHGAPLRIAVPWKYGYKNPKSIVKIELTREKPKTFWSMPAYAHEYGFLSNVNPNIPHPRWSQARSYWLGSGGSFSDPDWFETPIFNGYDSQVAALYPDEPRTMQQPLGRGKIAR